MRSQPDGPNGTSLWADRLSAAESSRLAVGEPDAPGLAAEGPEMRELLGTALEQAMSATRTARRAGDLGAPDGRARLLGLPMAVLGWAISG